MIRKGIRFVLYFGCGFITVLIFIFISSVLSVLFGLALNVKFNPPLILSFCLSVIDVSLVSLKGSQVFTILPILGSQFNLESYATFTWVVIEY